MAIDTPTAYRNLVIYEVYVRNHGSHGTFADVVNDLERIRSMGVDVLWLMPIHPIGQLNRKGGYGSPYSISDYRSINPEYGTIEDFKRLVEQAHRLGLKVMIDVVYNHTSHDSLLLQQRPEWFRQDSNGKPITTVPEWADVIDLLHPNPELWDYLINCLIGWVRLGVDGFRCDVASIIPVEFWKQAKQSVAREKSNMIWLAESVHPDFIIERRRQGLRAHSDGELYCVFDLTYDYDIWPVWQAVVKNELPLSRYLESLLLQEAMYPDNSIKLRCVENHDQMRIMKLAPSFEQALAWTAFAAFNKGAFLIYAGQESAAVHTPSLFDVDRVVWKDYPLQAYITCLAQLKKMRELGEGKFILLEGDETIQATWILDNKQMLYGVFNVERVTNRIPVQLPDGVYENILNDHQVEVVARSIQAPHGAVILRAKTSEGLREFSCKAINYHALT